MRPKEQIEKAFGKKKSLYDILNIKKDATSAVVRKAYFRMALTCHPDKCQDDPEATAKFQALSIIHATLSDENKRRSYDETGEIDDQSMELNQSEKEWYDYWRALFPEVTVEKIEKFQAEYQGSEEEKADVLAAYTEYEGRMTDVIDNVMLANDGDEDRFRKIVEAAIQAKEVKPYKAFKKQVKENSKRKAKAAKEAEEAEALLKAIQEKRGPNALANMAQDRKREMSSFLSSLEEKYVTKTKKTKTKRKQQQEQDIDDEEFEKLRASISKGGRE